MNSSMPGDASIHPHKAKSMTADDGTNGTSERNYK